MEADGARSAFRVDGLGTREAKFEGDERAVPSPFPNLVIPLGEVGIAGEPLVLAEVASVLRVFRVQLAADRSHDSLEHEPPRAAAVASTTRDGATGGVESLGEQRWL